MQLTVVWFGVFSDVTSDNVHQEYYIDQFDQYSCTLYHKSDAYITLLMNRLSVPAIK